MTADQKLHVLLTAAQRACDTYRAVIACGLAGTTAEQIKAIDADMAAHELLAETIRVAHQGSES